MVFEYIRNEMDEDYYKKLWNWRRKLARYPSVYDYVERDVKVGLLSEIGIDKIEVYCEGDSKGFLEVEGLKDSALNRVLEWTRYEANRYISGFQEWRRKGSDEREGARQLVMDFPGARFSGDKNQKNDYDSSEFLYRIISDGS